MKVMWDSLKPIRTRVVLWFTRIHVVIAIWCDEEGRRGRVCICWNRLVFSLILWSVFKPERKGSKLNQRVLIERKCSQPACSLWAASVPNVVEQERYEYQAKTNTHSKLINSTVRGKVFRQILHINSLALLLVGILPTGTLTCYSYSYRYYNYYK